ncbi:MAG: ECF transporter S component [Bacillota bacterium]
METRVLAKYAMFAVLVFVATYALKVPIFHGLPHMGDAVIMALALTFGKQAGAVAGALGAMLSALLSGYNILWLPVSFIIHGLEGYLTGWIGYNSRFFSRRLLAVVIGGLVMAVLYQGVSFLYYGIGAVLPQFIGNVLQFSSGVVVSLILASALERVKAMGG